MEKRKMITILNNLTWILFSCLLNLKQQYILIMPRSVDHAESIRLENLDKYGHSGSPNGVMTAQGEFYNFFYQNFYPFTNLI